MASSIEFPVHLITRNPKARQPVHVQLANLVDEPKAIAAFIERWGPVVVKPPITLEVRNGRPTLSVRDSFRTALEVRDVLRGAWCGESVAGPRTLRLAPAPPLRFTLASITVTGKRIEIEIAPSQPLLTALLLFARDRQLGRTAICEDPKCKAYFIRKRTTQKVCGPDCSGYGRRLRGLRWWRAHGEEWRSERKSKKK
jgi:hypothetical protein